MFDPFTAQEFQEGLRKWDRLRGDTRDTPATDESPESEAPAETDERG